MRRVLEEQADLEVVAEAGTAAAAVQRTAESHPDVVVMDLGLPDASGIDATRRVRDASPSTAVLVLTVHDDVGYLRQAFAAGATGYLVKDAADPELVAAVRTVAAGGRHVHPRLGAAAVGPEPSAAALAGPAASCPIARSRCSGTSPWALPTPRSPRGSTSRCGPSRHTVPTSI